MRFFGQWNVFDYVNTQLTHNKTYAYRLPPTYINQARALVDWHEDKVFSDSDMSGIGNGMSSEDSLS